jgi:hypothetical protein
MLVYRYKLKKDEMVPSSKAEFIVIDSGQPREHDGKPLAFDGKGHIFVPFGAPSDACQEENRVPGSPGMKPCPILDSNAGVWMFDENLWISDRRFRATEHDDCVFVDFLDPAS